MRPVAFPEANCVLTAPEGSQGVLPLTVYRDDAGHLVSMWRPTWRERLSVLFYGKIWLHFFGARTHSPVLLTATSDYLQPADPA